MFIYIHGFNSSSLSNKAQLFMQWCARHDYKCICHDLSHQPAEAIAVLSQTIMDCEEKPKLVGSSLGGFYATLLAERFSVKAVVINPVVHAGILFKPLSGSTQKNWKNWHEDYEYEFTQQHVDELNALDISAIQQPNNILMMQERGDETLDWKEAVALYRDCHQLVFRDGHHGFSRFEDVFELIERF